MIKQYDVVICVKDVDMDDVVFLEGEAYDVEVVGDEGIYIMASDGSSVLFESMQEVESYFMEFEEYKNKFE